MKLIGSEASPYVRFVRVALAELGMTYTFETTAPFAKLTAEQHERINQANPLMKVPVLETGDGTLFDSRVIVDWLLSRPGYADAEFARGFRENFDRINALTTAYGILESGVLRFLIRMRHPDTDMDSGYMGRSRERIDSGLSWLEATPVLGPSFGPPEALVCCALAWLERRSVHDVSAYSRLNRLAADYGQRPSLATTRIPEDA
ncbi:glutathione S-transferase family protein [Marinihelvus fidelis]|uniref:glutathione S-transferase family protein n=1 Tax=Marinihelvus fidelis TaxID=2613842 RepID=UPI001783D511|nr:glutathione S-transferase family protein [Marinihelvus fidelis]